MFWALKLWWHGVISPSADCSLEQIKPPFLQKVNSSRIIHSLECVLWCNTHNLSIAMKQNSHTTKMLQNRVLRLFTQFRWQGQDGGKIQLKYCGSANTPWHPACCNSYIFRLLVFLDIDKSL